MLHGRLTRRRAFTIVELLVVMAILVLLMALLLPSARRARYVAKLTVCAAQLKQVGAGVLAYTSDNATMYPYRQVAWGNNVLNNPRHSKLAFKPTQGGPDDRPMLRPYFPIDFLTCPFSPLEGKRSLDTSDRIDIHSSYEMYFGSPIVRNDPTTFLMKLSSKAMATDLATNKRFAVNILAGDMDWDYFAIGQVQTSHPDYYDGYLAFEHRNNHLSWQGNQWHEMSMWWNPSHQRGTIDRNFVYRDGSVRQLMNLKMYDERTIQIPARNDAPNSKQWNFIPKR